MKLNLLHETGLRKQDGDLHVFILDPTLIKKRNIGYHRLHFLLTMCLEQNIDVYEGNFKDVLDELIHTNNITEIILQQSDDPFIKDMIQSYANQLTVKWYLDDFNEFINIPLAKSFFTFYKQIEPKLKKRVPRHD